MKLHFSASFRIWNTDYKSWFQFGDWFFWSGSIVASGTEKIFPALFHDGTLPEEKKDDRIKDDGILEVDQLSGRVNFFRFFWRLLADGLVDLSLLDFVSRTCTFFFREAMAVKDLSICTSVLISLVIGACAVMDPADTHKNSTGKICYGGERVDVCPCRRSASELNKRGKESQEHETVGPRGEAPSCDRVPHIALRWWSFWDRDPLLSCVLKVLERVSNEHPNSPLSWACSSTIVDNFSKGDFFPIECCCRSTAAAGHRTTSDQGWREHRSALGNGGKSLGESKICYQKVSTLREREKRREEKREREERERERERETERREREREERERRERERRERERWTFE